MKNKFKVFFVASEVFPFIGKGRLAAVSGALPKALKDFGHDIRMMMPNYRGVNERKYVLRDVIRLKDMPVQFSGETVRASGKSAFLPDSKVQIYFLDYKPFFDRPNLYHDPKNKKPYPDNAERFLFFALGCIETLKLLHWQPEIIHCNDWQTALIPVLLKTVYKNDAFFKNTSVLLTAHNLADQGAFSTHFLEAGPIPAEQFLAESQAQVNGKLNFLKAGWLHADFINVAGEQYAKSLVQDADLAFGLGEVMQARRKAFTGITNGIDTAAWNPETDAYLKSHYSINNMAGKLQNKKEFAESQGLRCDEDIPLVAVWAQAEENLAVEEMEKLLARMLAMKTSIIVTGEIDAKLQKALARHAKQYSGQLAVAAASETEFAHRLLAAADVLLLTACNEAEPAVLLQAMCYGALPIALTSIGYAEAVQDFHANANSATGILFSRCQTSEMLSAVKNAADLFTDKKNWAKLVKNAMKRDFSWQSAAEKYTQLYSQMIARGKK